MKPNRLNPGDTIGIIAPSGSYDYRKDRIDWSVKYLENLGYKIKFAKNAKNKYFYSGGTVEERASDFNEIFANPEIKAVWCATGGSTANQILPYIDFENIKNNPKIFIGFSDITNFHLSILQKTGLSTFHGPNLATFADITQESRDFLLNLFKGNNQEHFYPKDFQIIKPGKVVGELVGGNLMIGNGLLGSSYSPSYENKIWFWEDMMESTLIEYMIYQLKISGHLDKVSGMVIGCLQDYTDKNHPENTRPIEDIILEATKNLNIPIIKVEYFGHKIPNFYTIPLGINASIDTNISEFKLIESSVI